VSNAELNTRYVVEAGSTIQSSAHGIIDFGGAVLGVGAPRVGPDGDNTFAPSDYPAPQLRKNSLICRVGSVWYQCGTASTFTPTEGGALVLRPNDAHLGDNSQEWVVSIIVTPPPR
jgi:hypothetical protein